MRSVLNRMALPPPTLARSTPDVRRDLRGLPSALARRARVVLTAIALVAAALLVAVGSWPLKALAVVVFIRGLFASDITAMRSSFQGSPHR
jgi:hypothetical protein